MSSVSLGIRTSWRIRQGNAAYCKQYRTNQALKSLGLPTVPLAPIYNPMKPMLAATCEDITKLRYPLLATPKIDGIRCLIINGVAMSRSIKPIPNRYIQRFLGDESLNLLDGELYLKPIKTDLLTPPREPTFQEVSSAIMSEDGEPDFIYRVFDIVLHLEYRHRIDMLRNHFVKRVDGMLLNNRIEFLFPIPINNRTALDEYTKSCMDAGHEGVMVRKPEGSYKFGRSTFNEHGLIKIKPFEDDEAEIVGFEEMMRNENEATTNALGRTERSHHQANMVGKNTLGALVCKSKLWPNVTFNIGTGMDDLTRANIWFSQADCLGKLVKYKYQKIGSLDRPRCPVFLGFRSTLDTSA